MTSRRFVFFFAFAFLLVAMSAGAQTFVFDLRGSQEVPPVPSPAIGGCMGVLDQGAATFSITCAHNVFEATVMHIHRAPAGANGDIVFDLGDPASPVTATWTSMTPANIADLLAGNLYINIHTAGRPSGEIRGQIISNVDVVAFTADGAQVLPPNGTSATANCTADLNASATSLAIQCTHTVASPDAAHIHEAPKGSNGPIAFTFPSATSPLNANMPMTPLLVAEYAATFLYLDIHQAGASEEDPGDEIRGQIGTPPTGPGTGTIIITKETFPSGGTGFSFTDTITPGSFTLDHGGTRTFTNVVPGTYSVSEDDPSTTPGGFTLAGLSCSDADSTTNVESRTATIQLDAGEVITCTFTNFATAPTDDLFVFHLSGDQEVPPVVTDERGGCMGRFNAGTSALSLVCTHNVNSPTLMHVHRAPVGENGDIAFDLGEPESPVIATWSGMTPANVADLFAGNLYINIHTSGRPSGAIRGQIVERSVDTIAFDADASQVVPPGTSPATADCTANLNDDATALAIDCTHTVPAPDAAHVHQAPRGSNGPIVYTFASPASPLNEDMPLTPRLVADFAATFLYLDIHDAGDSEEEAPDEIRGQIAPPVTEITTGTIRIRKVTSPAGGTNFAFTDNVPGSPGTFNLDDGEIEEFTNVPEGTYTFTEGPSSGYSLTDVSCDDDDSTGNPFARTATVQLQAGNVVTCTFHNLQNVAAPTNFVFHLSGTQEVPPNDSTARGGCYGQLDTAAATFSIVCTHNVADATIMHIHHGIAGVNGPIVFDLGEPTSPVEAVWTGMTPTNIAQLLAGEYYVNIHSGGRASGEIRGQILPRTVDSFAFPATGNQEVPPTDSTASGNCTADLADNATSVFVQCSHNVAAPIMVHLHAAPPGEDGPVIFDFNHLVNPFSGNAPLTPRLIADFAAGFLYVNIHSVDYDTGEIRGQLIAGPAAPTGIGEVPTLGTWALMIMAAMLVVIGWWKA